jgi:hypothetical protein
MIEGREKPTLWLHGWPSGRKEVKKERVKKPRKKAIHEKKFRSEDTEVQIYRASILAAHSMSSVRSFGDLFAQS